MLKRVRSTRPIMRMRQATVDLDGCEDLVADAQNTALSVADRKAASDKIITRWWPWIQAQARFYAMRMRRLDLCQDLAQVAICGAGKQLGGLMRAIETFDAARGAAFRVHGIYRVNAAFHEYSGNETTASRGAAGVAARIRHVAIDLERYLGRLPTYDEIRVAGAMDVRDSSDQRIQDALYAVGNSAGPAIVSLSEAPTRKATAAALRRALTHEARQENTTLANELLSALTPRELAFANAIFIEQRPLTEVAREAKISVVRVKQIVAEIKAKLKGYDNDE